MIVKAVQADQQSCENSKQLATEWNQSKTFPNMPGSVEVIKCFFMSHTDFISLLPTPIV